MQAVGGQDHQHREVRNNDGEVKGIKLVEAAEGIEIRVGELGPVMCERALRRQDHRNAVDCVQILVILSMWIWR